MSGAAMAMPQDPKAAFKAEWESLWKLFSINGLYEMWKQSYSALPLTARQTKPFLIFYCLFTVFILSVNVGIHYFNSISLFF